MVDLSSVGEKVINKVKGWLEQLFVMAPNIVAALFVVLVALQVSRWAERLTRSILFRLTGNLPISNLLGTVARAALVAVATFVALGLLNLDRTVTSLLAGVGVIGLALGFAFQDIAANFMSGFIMTIQRPFDVNDLVEVGNRLGRVKAIELRATELETLDGLSVIMPNKEVFQNAIMNYTKTPRRRLDLPLSVSYSADLEKARDVIKSAVAAIPKRDPGHEPQVFYTKFGDSSIEVVVRVWLTAADQLTWFDARSEAIMAIKDAFDREGIVIPFPTRTLDVPKSLFASS